MKSCTMKILGLIFALFSFSLHARNIDCTGVLKASSVDGTVTRVPFAILDYKIDVPNEKTIMLKQNGVEVETSLTDGDEPNSYKFSFHLENDQQLVGTLKINQLDVNLSSVIIKASAVIHGQISGTLLGTYSCTDLKF